MHEEDIKNLVSWLQAIYKESQTARGAVLEMRDKVNLIPEIRNSTNRGTQDSGDAERKIDETRHIMEDKINRMESHISELKTMINEIRSKVDRIR